MTDQAAPLTGGEGVSAPVTVVTPAHDGPINNARDASRQISAFRRKHAEQQAAPAAAPQEPPAVEPPKELADEASAAPPEEEAPGETQGAEPAVEELPPIEPPRSWTKEEKAEFATYPREAQEKIAKREQERERAIRQSQNEAAEQRKALETEKSAVAQARQQYESALPALLQTLQEQQAGEFSDIKTMADVERLAREDWPRYALWDAQQKKIAAVQQEVKASEERKAREFQEQWQAFSTKEDQSLLDKAPELADPVKGGKLRDAALSMLKDVGFKDQELAQLWNGQASVSLRDHRLQLLLLDGAKYREAQKAKQAAVAKPVPPVQRPGVAQSPNATRDQEIQTLKQRLDRTGGMKDAAALIMAQRKAARR